VSLQGRHALVTGAGRGIGAAVAQALLEQGAKITALGRDAAVLNERWGGRENVRTGVCDVTEEGQIDAAFAAAAEAFGPVDILVNNAGAEHSAPFHRTTGDDYRRMFEVNAVSAALGAQRVLAGLKGRDYGRIVNVASIAGLKGYGYTAAYTASKHALVGITRALADELKATPITVNAVCPGFVDTDMVARSIANITAKTGRSADEALSELVRANPQGRLVKPEEVAAAVVWLCSPQASSVTGHAIPIDGGETA
jgi:NAD(P)-dependent dehydrogenase (short-subunit alcohol dehydrogenase family)